MKRPAVLLSIAAVLFLAPLAAFAGLPREADWTQPLDDLSMNLETSATRTEVTAQNPEASAYIDGILVEGTPEFLDQTRAALSLLEKAGYIQEISQFIKVIRQDQCSGINVQASVFYVGDPTWKAGTIWFAGSIAHDSRHSRLYHDAKAAAGGKEPDENIWMGAEAEKRCLAFQLTALQALGADQATLDYIRELMKNPNYQNIGKDKSGLDVCRDRNWSLWIVAP